MNSESLEHIFTLIGIISTWILPLWLYFYWRSGSYDKMFVDFIVAMGCTIIYFEFIAHYFEFTVRISV